MELDPKLQRLRAQSSLIRRGYIRRLLTESYMTGDWIFSRPELRRRLIKIYKIGTSIESVERDLRILRAVKVRVPGVDKLVWAIPAYGHDMVAMRPKLDESTIEQEISTRLYNFALEVFISESWVILVTDKFCGKMIGEWIALLTWPEIIHVISHDHTVIVMCIDKIYADVVRARLIGDIAVEVGGG